MAGSINDWFLGRQLTSLGDALDDEAVEWQPPWDLLPAQPPTPRASEAARAARRRKAGRDAASGRSGQQRATGIATRTKTASGAKLPVIPKSLRLLIQAAIRESPGEGSKRIAATMRASGVPVTKAQVAEIRRQMHAAKRQRAEDNRRATRRAPTRQSPPPVERPRVPPEMPLCNACGIRITTSGTCRCS